MVNLVGDGGSGGELPPVNKMRRLHATLQIGQTYPISGQTVRNLAKQPDHKEILRINFNTNIRVYGKFWDP